MIYLLGRFHQNVNELVLGKVGEFFPSSRELLVNLDSGFSHSAVRLFRTASEIEIVSLCDPCVAVLVVQADAEQESLGLPVIFFILMVVLHTYNLFRQKPYFYCQKSNSVLFFKKSKKNHLKANFTEQIPDFKNGSEEAFNQLISRYASKMFQTAYGLIGSREDAEEVVQDAFVRIYKHLDQFRGDSSFSTWVYRIVVNLSRNKYQWNRRRGSDLTFSISGDYRDDDDGRKEDFNLPDTKLGPLRILEEADEQKRIIQIMDSLPDKLREVLLLRHIKELSYEEIASLLDCNLGTVKSRIARAREAMIELMKKEKAA